MISVWGTDSFDGWVVSSVWVHSIGAIPVLRGVSGPMIVFTLNPEITWRMG